MKKYSKQDQKALADAAADWAKRVLPYFEEECAADRRPRQAIAACRKWVRTGIFHLSEIRGASLAAHAAARNLTPGSAAAYAAHAAGQAVATAHVAQHAFGAAYYALKAICAADQDRSEAAAAERLWESRRLPPRLRQEFMNRLTVQFRGGRGTIRLRKGDDF